MSPRLVHSASCRRWVRGGTDGGSAAGRGVASSGAFNGIAPAAMIVFQSLLDGSGRLGGLPLNLGELFDEVYHMARVVENLPDLAVLVEPMLVVRLVLHEQILILHRRLLASAMMTFQLSVSAK
jgi:hypothetical protein